MFRLPLWAAIVAPIIAEGGSPEPPLTLLRRDVGVGVPSTFADDTMPYRYAPAEVGTGRFLLNRIVPPGPIGPGGEQAPHGYIQVDGRTETADNEYVYVNLLTESSFTGHSGGPGASFISLDDIPFNMVFFSTSEPLPYGIEMVSPNRAVTAGQHSVVSHLTALVRDPGREEFLDRSGRLGYRHSSVLTIPLRANQLPENIVYRQRNNTIEGVAQGTLPPGDYGLSTLVEYSVNDGLGDDEKGDHGILSTMQSWIIVGKVAAWREAVSGAYLAAQPWIAQQQPQADFRVLFNRPSGEYTVTGVAGTVRRFDFGGDEQILTMEGGAAFATVQISLVRSQLKLSNVTLTTPKVTIVGTGSSMLEVQAGGNLRADAPAGGELLVGEMGTGKLVVRPDGHVRGGQLVAGMLEKGGGKRPSAGKEKNEPQNPATSAVQVTVEDGNMHVGSQAYASGEALALTNSVEILNSRVQCTQVVVDETLGAMPVKVAQGKWLSQSFTLGQFGLARARVELAGALETSDLTIGLQSGGDGTLTVTDQASIVKAQTTAIGKTGRGRLEIMQSGEADLGAVSIGASGAGNGTLSMANSAFIAAQGVIVGQSGTGTLDASANSFLNSQSLDIASQAGSTGTVNLHGSGTMIVTSLGTVGAGGHGVLDIFDGGVLVGSGGVFAVGGAGDGSVKIRGNGSRADDFGFNISRNGRLDISGGGKMGGSAGGIVCGEGGTVTISESPENVLAALFSESPDFEIKMGSTLTVTNVRVESTGALRLLGAGTVLTVGEELLLNGRLEVSNGAVVAAGSGDAVLGIGPGGRISGGGGSIQFPAGQIDNAFGAVLPGNSPGRLTIESNYVQGAGGALELEIGGTLAGVTHDQLVVTGDMVLNGVVVLRFINDFVPQAGQQFNLIMVGGTLSGNPTVVVRGLAPGWQFTTMFNGGTGTLQLVSQNDGAPFVPPPGGDLGDNDQDGLSYLLEIALGTDPDVPSAESAPTLTVITDPSDNKRYLIYTYRRGLAATDGTFTVETSTDLFRWNSGSAFVQTEGQPVVTPDGLAAATSVRIFPALEDAPGVPRYVRLRVSR